MKTAEHNINHQYQPTNTTCSPTALSMLLDHYGSEHSVDEISEQVPQVKNEQGEDSGSVAQQMATWAISLGFKATFYTFDCQIIDQSWSVLEQAKLLERLELRKTGSVVPSMGAAWTEAYAQSYIDLINAGGELIIQPAATSSLLYTLLEEGPVFVSVCLNTLYGRGRSSNFSEAESAKDDINGRVWNHSIIVYGNDADGNFLVADPDQGLVKVDAERMVAAIATAQIECDNLLFQISAS